MKPITSLIQAKKYADKQWLDGVALPTKHRALYVVYTVPNYQIDIGDALMGEGISMEITNWVSFVRNVDYWVNEFDILIFYSRGITLNHLAPISAQDVLNALVKWKNAGKKFIYYTISYQAKIIKKDIEGNDAESVDFRTQLFPHDRSSGNIGSNLKDITDISDTLFGHSIVNRPDLILKATTNGRLMSFAADAIPIFETSDGVTSNVLAIYKPNEYCVITNAGSVAGDTETTADYRYINAGVVARYLLGNRTSVRLAHDCMHSRKIAASGIDNDVSLDTKASDALIRAYNGRPLEMGLVSARVTDEVANWYRSRYSALELVSHSTYHFETGIGTTTATDEEHVISNSRVITVKNPYRVEITTVKIDGVALSAKTFIDVLTASQYGHDGHGRIKFHSDHIGKTVQVTYNYLKEIEEWLTSIQTLEEKGALTNAAVYLTAGYNSLSASTLKLAQSKGITLCDHVNPHERSYFLMEENLIPKMPQLVGTTIHAGFTHWENLVRDGGFSRDEILQTKANVSISVFNQRRLPFVWYQHDFMFSNQTNHANAIWGNVTYHPDWQKATYEDTIEYAVASFKEFLALLDAQNVYWMTRSNYCRRYDYMNRSLHYSVEEKGKTTLVQVRNTGDKPIYGTTFRSTGSVSSVKLLPNNSIPVVQKSGDYLFSFDLLAGQTVLLEITHT